MPRDDLIKALLTLMIYFNSMVDYPVAPSISKTRNIRKEKIVPVSATPVTLTIVTSSNIYSALGESVRVSG
jgi:hypothetical protein